MKAYFFDFDGTLVDSMPLLVRVTCKQLTDHGITPPPTDELLATIIPIGYFNAARYLVSLGIPKTPEEVLSDLYRDVAEGYLSTVPAKRNAAPLLRHLAEKGHDLYVLTAGAPTVVAPCLERLGLLSYFKDLLFTDRFSMTKKEPDFYLAAAAHVDKPIAECIFVDDNAENIAAAKKAGMATVGMYDEGSAYGWEDMKKAADLTIHDFAELIK